MLIKQILYAALITSLLCSNTLGNDRPNLLLLSIDDLNDWVGCMGGHAQAKTPNIDRLAQRGVLFTNAHCQAPLCGPSRASFGSLDVTHMRRGSTSNRSRTPWPRTTLLQVLFVDI